MIGDQAANEEDLLCILLAKDSDIRLDHVEKPGNDREHAVEVPRAGGSLKRVTHGTGRESANVVTGRIHIVDARGENSIGDSGECGDIRIERAGIAVEIFARAELERVHKDRNHDPVGQLSSSSRERHVTFVECAHRWNERNRAGGCPAPGVEFGLRVHDGRHAGKPWVRHRFLRAHGRSSACCRLSNG